jgi:diguanylate cyclase (GGDEF)-like protein/PAS domain S-box-containing protein
VSARRTRWWWMALAAIGLAATAGLIVWSANLMLSGAGLLLALCAGLLHQHGARRATEARLREHEALIRLVVDDAIDAIMTVDPQGAVASFNLAAERMFGWPSAEIIGQSVDLLFTSEPGREGPDQGSAERPATRANAIRAGAREALAERRDGAPFPVYLTCSEAHQRRSGLVTVIARDLTQYKQTAEALQLANGLLEAKVGELEERTRVIALLGQMSDVLQAAVDPADAYASIAGYAQQLFPRDSGALFAVDPAKEVLEVAATWGEPTGPSTVAPGGCQALRNGRIHAVNAEEAAGACPHASSPSAAGHACMPVTSLGEQLGVACFHWHAPGAGTGDAAAAIAFRTKVAAAFAKQVGLALTNLRLKEKLRGQAIHDPLTGLHNRRFLEEAFHRELLRAASKRSPVGVLMLDLDHFKEFNDAHGHAAGDALLRAFAVQLRSDIRAEDIACRYGGEEFAVILPDATLEQAMARAEQIREGMRSIVVDFQGKRLAGMTISIGVAGLPAHGASPDALLRAADAALYAAKAEGRDRTRLAAAIPESTAGQPGSSARARKWTRSGVGS